MELKEFSQMMVAISLKLDQMMGTSGVSGASSEGGSGIPTKPRTGSNSGMYNSQMRFSKLNFPTFKGENPSCWVYKCERFFKYNGVEESDMLVPDSVLDRRVVKRSNRPYVQWLVQWSNSFPENATWEDAFKIQEKFPLFKP
ncbi:hypothetical protein WN943_022922 [Citrus x changshan-huyou]